MKLIRSFNRVFKSTLSGHGFVKSQGRSFVTRINPDTQGRVGMAISGEYGTRPLLRPFVGVINEQVLELQERTWPPDREPGAGSVVGIELEKLLTPEELDHPFIGHRGDITEWVLEPGNESEVARHMVDGIVKYGLPLMHRSWIPWRRSIN